MYITEVAFGMEPSTSNETEPDSSHESKVRCNPTDGSMPHKELRVIQNCEHQVLHHVHIRYVENTYIKRF